MRRINSRISPFPALVVPLGFMLLVATFHGVPGPVASAAKPQPGTTPAVQITPNSGPYGTETVVTGQGFAPPSRWPFTRKLVHSSRTTRMLRAAF